MLNIDYPQFNITSYPQFNITQLNVHFYIYIYHHIISIYPILKIDKLKSINTLEINTLVIK